jgi:hypothetical protein
MPNICTLSVRLFLLNLPVFSECEDIGEFRTMRKALRASSPATSHDPPQPWLHPMSSEVVVGARSL